MTVEDVLARLEALGHEHVRERNRKLGWGDEQFGVRLGDVRKLAREIRSEHELGLALWETGNLDARLAAILVMRPKRLSSADVDRLVCSARFAQLADWLNAYVVKDHPDAESLRQAWMAADDPWAARAGWSLTAGRVARSPDGLDLGVFRDYPVPKGCTSPFAPLWIEEMVRPQG